MEPSALNELLSDIVALLIDNIDLSLAALLEVDIIAFDVVFVEFVVPNVHIRVYFYLEVVGIYHIVFTICGVDHLKSEEVGTVRAAVALLRIRFKVAQFLGV